MGRLSLVVATAGAMLGASGLTNWGATALIVMLLLAVAVAVLLNRFKQSLTDLESKLNDQANAIERVKQAVGIVDES